MSPVRRASAPPAPAANLVNFGSLDFYEGGGGSFGIPEGYYALFFDVMMHQFTKRDGTPGRGAPSLKVRVSAYSLKDPQAPAIEGFYSMGSKTHLSFQPDPATGKGLVAVPGGPASTANDKTNWAVLLKSLYDSGLPQGVFLNSFEAIDGVWAHMIHIPEPEERKSFAKGPKTGEQQQEDEQRKDATIAVVSEILDEGHPWEGTGGVPDAPVEFDEPAPAPVAAPKKSLTPPVTAPRPRTAPVKAALPAPVDAEAGDEDVEATATNAAVELLTKNPKGMPKMALRSGVFKALASDDEMRQAVMSAFFSGDDDATNRLIAPLGFTVSGPQIVPVK